MNTKKALAERLYGLWESDEMRCSALAKKNYHYEKDLIVDGIIEKLEVNDIETKHYIDSEITKLMEDAQKQAFLHGFYVHENLTQKIIE